MIGSDPNIDVVIPALDEEGSIVALTEQVILALESEGRSFEIVFVDDGSTDATTDILAGYGDSRLRVVDNDSNLGLIASLNKGMDLAEGEFVARMDSDDASFPKRLASQIAFMRANQS